MNVYEQPEAGSEQTSGPSPTVAGEGSPGAAKVFVLAVVALVALYWLATFVDVWLTSRRDYDPDAFVGDSPRAAVVLGAAQYNGEPSPVLRSRLDTAAELYERGDVDLVVVTGGGQADDLTTEAKTGYDYLRESGIPDGRLRLEVQGASTYQSLAATARFLRQEAVVDVVLVTDRYHVKRSILIAEEVGLRPVVSPTAKSPSLGRLARESLAVGIGRLIGFRRLDRF